jgi:CheY-like chemotaxis protein
MQSKVLVIDDDDVNHDIVNSMLGLHYDITSALGGKQGLELLSQAEYDAVKH